MIKRDWNDVMKVVGLLLIMELFTFNHKILDLLFEFISMSTLNRSVLHTNPKMLEMDFAAKRKSLLKTYYYVCLQYSGLQP